MAARRKPAPPGYQENIEDRDPEPSDKLTEIPMAPEVLGDEGRKKWGWFCQKLIDREIMSSDWLEALEQLCLLYDHLEQIEIEISNDGLMLEPSTPNGMPRQNPLVKAKLDVIKVIRQYLGDFGLSPATARATNVPVNGSRPSTVPRGKKGRPQGKRELFGP